MNIFIIRPDEILDSSIKAIGIYVRILQDIQDKKHSPERPYRLDDVIRGLHYYADRLKIVKDERPLEGQEIIPFT